MSSFRKKPIVIEAWQIPPNDDATRDALPAWIISALTAGVIVASPEGFIACQTLEGVMKGGVGDWLIKGIKGEIYPCKPDIFDATYEACA